MNILYNIPNLSQEGGGSRQYSIALLKILAKIEFLKIFVLHQKGDSEILEIIDDNEKIILIPSKVAKEKFYEKKLNELGRIKSLLSLVKGAPLPKTYSFYNRLCKKYNIDLVYSPTPSLMASYADNVIKIGTCHDLQELHLPENFTGEGRLRRARVKLEFFKRTDKIICSFNHVKEDLIKYFGISDSEIEVILLEMQNLWFADYNDDDIVRLPEDLDNCPFLFYPANTWQHKNHIKLIEAFKIVHQKNPDLKLICTGHMREYYHETIKPFIEKEDLVRHVRFLGLVDEEILYSLYQKCKSVIVPTKYEAGSFPLIESMIMGVPVICSRTTSLPETIDNEKFTFDADDVYAMADLMLKIVEDQNFTEENLENSKIKHVNLFKTGAEEKLRRLLLSYSKN